MKDRGVGVRLFDSNEFHITGIFLMQWGGVCPQEECKQLSKYHRLWYASLL